MGINKLRAFSPSVMELCCENYCNLVILDYAVVQHMAVSLWGFFLLFLSVIVFYGTYYVHFLLSTFSGLSSTAVLMLSSDGN